MSLETLVPDALITQTNLSGDVSAIQNGVDTPSGTWLTAPGSNNNTEARASFPTPTAEPTVGANLQTLRAWVRKTNHPTNPTAVLALIETAGGTNLAETGATAISSITGQMLTLTFDANLLATDDGSAVEARVIGTVGTGPAGNRASVEVGEVEWNADVTVAGPTGPVDLVTETDQAQAVGVQDQIPLAQAREDDTPQPIAVGSDANELYSRSFPTSGSFSNDTTGFTTVSGDIVWDSGNGFEGVSGRWKVNMSATAAFGIIGQFDLSTATYLHVARWVDLGTLAGNADGDAFVWLGLLDSTSFRGGLRLRWNGSNLVLRHSAWTDAATEVFEDIDMVGGWPEKIELRLHKGAGDGFSELWFIGGAYSANGEKIGNGHVNLDNDTIFPGIDRTRHGATNISGTWTGSFFGDEERANGDDNWIFVIPSSGTPLNQAAETNLAQPINVQDQTPVDQSSETDLAQALGVQDQTPLAQTSETDLAQAVGLQDQTPVGPSAETDQAQPLTLQDQIPISQVHETDLAQAITVLAPAVINQAQETNGALSVGVQDQTPVGQTREDDTAHGAGVKDQIPVSQTQENDSALAVGVQDQTPIGQPVEADAAQAIIPVSPGTIELTSETNLAQAIGVEDQTALTQAEENDLAQGITAQDQTALGQAEESNDAQALRVHDQIPVARASETDQARTITADSADQLTQAHETDLAQSLGVQDQIPVGLANEQETAQPIGVQDATALSQSAETNQAQTLGVQDQLPIAQAQEEETARTITPVSADVLGQADETNAANPILVQDAVALGQASEHDSTQAIGVQDQTPLEQAAEQNESQSISVQDQVALGLASETNIAQTMSLDAPVVVGQAGETETARPIAVGIEGGPPLQHTELIVLVHRTNVHVRTTTSVLTLAT